MNEIRLMKILSRFAFPVLIFSTLFAITASAASASGVTWTNQTTGTSASDLNWFSITSSSDGTKLAAVVSDGDIWTSTNSGATWTDQTTGTGASGLHWLSITSSSDGTKLAAAVGGEGGPGDIWTSTNSGATWTDQTTGTGASDLNWLSMTSSSDGTKLAAVAYGGDISTSTDSGQHWTNQTTGTGASGLSWFSITSSSDGTKLAATVIGGDIWTASLATPPAPAPNPSPAPSGGGGMIVGSGPLAPSAAGVSGPGYTPPRPQIDYPSSILVQRQLPRHRRPPQRPRRPHPRLHTNSPSTVRCGTKARTSLPSSSSSTRMDFRLSRPDEVLRETKRIPSACTPTQPDRHGQDERRRSTSLARRRSGPHR
jgi:hypothetical protein